MSLWDQIAKGALAASFANEERKKKVKETLERLFKEIGHTNPLDETVLDRYINEIIEVASFTSIAGAVAKELGGGLFETPKEG